MRIITDISKASPEPKAIALGTFDGVHLGHRAVIRAACDSARDGGLIPAVFTFSGLPRNAFCAGGSERIHPLCTFAEKARLIEALGVELMFAPAFTKELYTIPAEEFISEILIKRLGARHIVCGFDHRFGAGGAGNVELLMSVCREKGCAVTILPPVTVNGEKVSSTRIRALLERGYIDNARELLGHGI